MPEVETVRHGRLIAVTAVALVGMSGCADRPNDLDTYYDEPVRDTEVAPSTVGSVSPTPAPRTSAVTPPSFEPPTSVLLTDADVASEGVISADPPSAMEGCLGELPPGVATSASWRYPTGSQLNQYVVGYQGESGSGVVERLRCGDAGAIALSAPEGTSAHRAWCVGPTCTVVLARDDLVSAVQVAAGSPERAAEAAVRLAPVLATALARR